MPNDYDAPALDGNFAELLWGAGRRFGDRPAMRHRDGVTTFAEIVARAAVFAESLIAAGVREGDAVAVFLRTPEDAAAGFFAALAVGAVGININELYRPRQVEYVLGHAKAKALLTSGEVLRLQPRPMDTNVPIIDAERLPAGGGSFTPVSRRPEDPAQVTYTSGSTGQPKGVLVSHGNLAAGARIVAAYLGIEPTDRIASVLPFSFVYGFNQLALSLYTGAVLVIERSSFAQDIVATLRREQVSVLAAVPPLWQSLLRVPEFAHTPLDHLRILTNAGGRIPPSSAKELRRAQPQAKLFLMYGLTEVFRSTYLPPELADVHPDSMGRAIPESVVYVVRSDGTLCDVGEVGELVHGGPTVGTCYLHDPEATARVFRPNPFARPGDGAPPRVVYSGDLVRRDAEGLLYYVGRRDRMFKTLGYRVSPDEITDVVYASGQVSECVVVTEPDPTRGERIVACIVLREGGSIEELRRYCGTELPRYMQPARYEVSAELPRNSSGKHDVLAIASAVRGATAVASSA